MCRALGSVPTIIIILKSQIELTGAALEGTKESMSFLMILPSGPVPEETHKHM